MSAILEQDVASPVRMTIPSPVGPLLAIANDAGIVSLNFVKGEQSDQMGCNAHLDRLARELAEYFAGKRTTFETPVVLAGSLFQRKVWEYLIRIPFGQTRTYGAQAKAIGLPTASRAVGAANGQNRIAILVPCHRVIGANGKLTGYAGGMDKKRWLLDHEQGLFS